MMRRKPSPALPEGSRRSGHLPLVLLAHLELWWSRSQPEQVTGPPDACGFLGEAELLSEPQRGAGVQTVLDNPAGVPGGVCKPGAGCLAGLLGV